MNWQILGTTQWPISSPFRQGEILGSQMNKENPFVPMWQRWEWNNISTWSSKFSYFIHNSESSITIPSQNKNEHTTLVWKLNSISLLFSFSFPLCFVVHYDVSRCEYHFCLPLLGFGEPTEYEDWWVYWFCKILIYLWILSAANYLFSVEQLPLSYVRTLYVHHPCLLNSFRILHLCLLFNLYDPLSSFLIVSTSFRSFHIRYQYPVPPIIFHIKY